MMDSTVSLRVCETVRRTESVGGVEKVRAAQA